MTRLILTVAAATLVVFSPAFARAQAAQGEGVVGETIVKINTPSGPKWLSLGEGVEAIDVTKGGTVRFNYEGGSIDAIEVSPEGTPVEGDGDTATQKVGTPAPEVDGTAATGTATPRDEGEVAEIIVRIETADGPRWYQLGQDVEAVDVTKGKTVRFSYEGDSIDAIEVTPEGAPVSSGN